MASFYLIIRLLLGLALTIFVGYNILIMIFRKNIKELNNLEKFSISFSIGISFITLEMMIFSNLKLEWSIINIFFPWVIIFFINLLLPREGIKIEKKHLKKPQRLNLIEKLLISAIVLEIIYVLFKAFSFPLSDYDGLAIYGIKAKAFYLKGTIYTDIFTEKVFLPTHWDYPLLLPLAETWIYKIFGEFNDYFVKILFPAYFLMTLAVFYSVMIRFFKRKQTILFTFFLASVSQFRNFGAISYAEIILTFYFTLSMLYLFLWMKKGNIGYLLVSSLAAFSCMWTKNEGSMLFMVNLAILAIFLLGKKINFRKKIFYFSAYLLIVVILFSPWLIFKNSIGASSDIMNRETLKISRFLGNLNRIGPILYEYQKHIFGPKKWNIIWILIISIFALKFKNIFKGDHKYLTYAIIFCILGYSLVYIMTPQDLGWHLSTSASRIILHFLPISFFWAALLTKEELDAF